MFIMHILLFWNVDRIEANITQSLVNYPIPGKIVILASTPIPEGIMPSRKDYEELIDCGFNCGMTNGSLNFFKNQFKLIKGLDFKILIVHGDLLNDRRTYFIDVFKTEPQLAGWRFKDEPYFNNLNTLVPEYQKMCIADPNRLVYINLSGEKISVITGNLPTYFNYLELIEEKFKPQVWSYDFYPIKIIDRKIVVAYDEFYSDLEDFSTISQKTGRPFWAYCESMAYKTSSYARPAATEAYLRWEAFSALAYGAQGIVYWTYGQRKSNSVEDYTSALVNLNGKKSKAWNAAKKVNGEIKKYNDIFYQCKVKEVRHTGDRIYKGTRKLSGAFGPLQMVRSQNAGVVLSQIEKNGKEYIVVVSRDVLKKQKVTLELVPNMNITDLTVANPKKYTGQKVINFTLSAGGYKIFEIGSD